MPFFPNSFFIPTPFSGGGAVLSNQTTFTVDGVVKVNGDTVNLANGVTSATIAATNGGSITTGPTGDSGLITGDNPCTFTITAEDGVTTLDVTITLHVLDLGLKETTEVTCWGDTGGSLHNTNFRIFRASGERAVVLNCGAKSQETKFDFNGLDPLDFVTAGFAKYVEIFDESGFLNVVWINMGTETPPPGSGFTLVEVPVNNPVASLVDIAQALMTALVGMGAFVDAGSSGTVTDVVYAAAGQRGSASAGTTGAAVTTLVQGRNAAGAVDGVTSIIVDIADNDMAAAIAPVIAAACDSQGWAVGALNNVVTFEDAAPGSRTDASDAGTGFGINITQQGRGPL